MKYLSILILALAVLPAVHSLSTAGAPPPAETVSPITRVIAEGRLLAYPDHEVTVGSELTGLLTHLAVQEKDVVHKGELIAELKADDYRADCDRVKALIAQEDANIRYYERQVARAGNLLSRRLGSEEALDHQQWQLDSARARRAALIADLQRLQAVLAKTRILAPLDGVVIGRHADTGEIVPAGSPLVTIADLSKTRIEAEVDEFDAGRIHLGDKVLVTAEGHEGLAFAGRIEEIPDAVAERRIRPQDPARPVDVRVLLVKIALEQPTALKLRQRVEVEIRAVRP